MQYNILLSGYNSNTLRKALGEMVKAILDDILRVIIQNIFNDASTYWDQFNMRFFWVADFFFIFIRLKSCCIHISGVYAVRFPMINTPPKAQMYRKRMSRIYTMKFMKPVEML